MLISVFGTPSALTAWTVHFATVAADILWESHHFIASVFLRDLKESWARRNGKPVIFHSDSPEQALVDLFLDGRIPVVVVCDDPGDVVGYAMAARNLDMRQALRFSSQAYSTLSELFCSQSSTVISPKHYSRSLSSFTREFLEAFGINPDDSTVRTITSKMSGNPKSGDDETVIENVRRHLPLARSPGTFESGWNAEDHRLARSIIEQYHIVTKRQPIKFLNWPREILPDFDRLGGAHGSCPCLDGYQSLLGPGRILTAGHALHLPRGHWRVSVQISVKDNWSGNKIASDILLGDVSVGGIVARLPPQGSFGYHIEFEVADAFPPTQVRIVLGSGLID